MQKNKFIYLVLLVFLVSCGEYEKLLKSTDYDLKKEKAKEYFDAGQYVKATQLLSQVLTRYRATEESEDLALMNAQAYYGMKDYYSAGSYFKNYTEMYPYGKHTEEATFMSALCDYNISPRAELDQENTNKALEGFTIFLVKYPRSERVKEAEQYVTELKEKLVEKSYLSARLYYDMTQYKAAITALSNSLKEYSDSKYREEMMFLKLNSLFLYAENSLANRQRERYQDTLDDYFSFMEEFPESKYAKDVERIYEVTSKALKIETTDSQTNN